MATPVRDKYYLKTLHEDIGLLDRKIAHLLKYETFESDEDRKAAAQKLTTKRATLLKTAQQMATDGIEYSPAPSNTTTAPHPSSPTTPSTKEPSHATQMLDAVYAGTSLDYRSGLEDYKRSRRKTA